MATRSFSSILKPYEVKPTAKHTATVIFLHGLGDSGNGWLPVAESIKLELPHIKWLLPNAPTRRITSFGVERSGWFDLLSPDPADKKEDRKGMFDSARRIDKHIQDEIDAGIPADRIVVGGFSQGGVMSIFTGLTAGEGREEGWKLGGVVVLSGWMPLRDEFPKMASPHLSTIPILVGHGTADPLVPYELSEKTKETIKSKGVQETSDMGATRGGLSFIPYKGVGHQTSPQTLKDLKEFLKNTLPCD